MALDVQKLTPTEAVRLLNSTPLGTVLSAATLAGTVQTIICGAVEQARPLTERAYQRPQNAAKRVNGFLLRTG